MPSLRSSSSNYERSEWTIFLFLVILDDLSISRDNKILMYIVYRIMHFVKTMFKHLVISNQGLIYADLFIVNIVYACALHL